MFSLTKRCADFCSLYIASTDSSFRKWSGAEYIDSMLVTVTGGISSTTAMGKGVTEAQFATKGKL